MSSGANVQLPNRGLRNVQSIISSPVAAVLGHALTKPVQYMSASCAGGLFDLRCTEYFHKNLCLTFFEIQKVKTGGERFLSFSAIHVVGSKLNLCFASHHEQMPLISPSPLGQR